MSLSLQLTIHESQQELERNLRTKGLQLALERLQMPYWLKQGIANKNHKELAQLLHRNEARVSQCFLRYRCCSLAKQLEVYRTPGNPGKIPLRCSSITAEPFTAPRILRQSKLRRDQA